MGLCVAPDPCPRPVSDPLPHHHTHTHTQFLAIRLRSMFMQMGHPVRMSHYWGDYAEKVLRDEGCPYELWTLDYAREIMRADLRIVKG